MSGSEVRRIREGMGLTQAEFAREVGVIEHTVWRWESGLRAVSGAYPRLILGLARGIELPQLSA